MSEVDPQDLVELAIESVLDQVPDVGEETAEESPRYQPWADTAAPPGKNKRPLADLLAEYATRVAADPGAVAGRPGGKRAAASFFDRFGPARRQGPPGGESAASRGRRRRRTKGRHHRGRGGGGTGGRQA